MGITEALDLLLKYWVLIVAFVAGVASGIKYLSTRSKQHERNVIALEEIVKTNKEIKETVTSLDKKVNALWTDMKILETKYQALLDDYKEISERIKTIEER